MQRWMAQKLNTDKARRNAGLTLYPPRSPGWYVSGSSSKLAYRALGISTPNDNTFGPFTTEARANKFGATAFIGGRHYVRYIGENR